MKESTLITKIRDYWGSDAYIVKQHGNIYTAIGTPDLLICYQGYFVALEAKVGKNKPTPRQVFTLEQIAKNGGFAFVVNEKDYKDTIDLVKRGIECKLQKELCILSLKRLEIWKRED